MNNYKYIGLDAHSSTCNFCVMDGSGKIRDDARIATNGRLLRECAGNVPGRKKLTFEECEMSTWLYEMFKNENCELMVCNPVTNRQYRKAKTDKLDARQLADLLRGDFLIPVYHDGSEREKFRDLMSAYRQIIEEIIRTKCRYKSLFRKDGKRPVGGQVYTARSRIEELKRTDLRFIAERTYDPLEELERSRGNTREG